MKTRSSRKSTRSTSSEPIARPNRRDASKIAKPSSQKHKTTTRKRSTRKKNSTSILAQYHKQLSLDPNAASPNCRLLRLPLELFQHITIFLPPEAVVCLSLTCKLALQYIGPECWKHREIRGHQYFCRQHLMSHLIRDKPPNLMHCKVCATLHPPLKPPREHRVTKQTNRCMGQWGIIDYIPQVRDQAQKRGYSLLYTHIADVFAQRATVDLLAGSYTTSAHPAFDYSLNSVANWIFGCLVLRHTHVFAPRSGEPLELSDLLALPIRLCPHHSTATVQVARSWENIEKLSNGPMLTHAIASKFPPTQRTALPEASSVFRSPKPSEQEQMDRADAGENVVWKCRGCTTKFHVEMRTDGSLEVVTWHYFGADQRHASMYWSWLVRREVVRMGEEKKNFEYCYPKRDVLDFEAE